MAAGTRCPARGWSTPSVGGAGAAILRLLRPAEAWRRAYHVPARGELVRPSTDDRSPLKDAMRGVSRVRPPPDRAIPTVVRPAGIPADDRGSIVVMSAIHGDVKC